MTGAVLQEARPYREYVRLSRRAELLAWLEERDWVSLRTLNRWTGLTWRVHRNGVYVLLSELVEEGLLDRRLTVANLGQPEFRLPGGPAPVPQLAPASSPFQLVLDALQADPDRAWTVTELALHTHCKPKAVQRCLARLSREGQAEAGGWHARRPE